jgi:predicted permease
LPALLHFAPESIRTVEPGLNGLVVAFALTISIATGLLFALAPSITAARRDPAILIRASSRTRTSLTRGLRILVATQTGLATLLLISAGLLGKSMRQLNAVNPGVASDARVTLNLNVPSSRYRSPERVIAFYDALQQRVAAQPGVLEAVLIRHVPLRDGFRRENVLREGTTGAGNELSVALQAAGPGVLHTMGIPLLAGRDLESSDRSESIRVGLINEAAAKALWPGESAIGRRLRATFTPPDAPPITIVGVYADVRSAGLSSAPTPELVLPVAQCGMMLGWLFNPKLIVHAAGDPEQVIALARAAVRAIDPAVAAEKPTTMQDVLYDSAARERFLTFLLSLFGVLAVTIAGIGVFGVVSFTVAKQQREFAVRNALGAQPGQILRGVVRTNALVAGAGALLGTAAAVAYAPALSSFLYQVSPRDVAVVGGMPLLIVALALLSALVPAWRATRAAPAHLLQDGEC